MPRAALPRSGQSGEAIIMLAAFGIASLFVAVQIGFAVTVAPIVIGLYEQAGLELPSMLALAETLGPLGIIIVMGILDALVFGVCVLAARKYWVGLLFVPPAIYLATTLALFTAFLGGSAAAALVG
jgi:hypothetical protein